MTTKEAVEKLLLFRPAGKYWLVRYKNGEWGYRRHKPSRAAYLTLILPCEVAVERGKKKLIFE